jgi:MraZ protein
MAEVVDITSAPPERYFRGSNVTRVDEKHRLKLSSDFKRLVDDLYETEKPGNEALFYITSTDGKVARLYPIREWQAIEKVLSKLPSTDPARARFQKVTAYYGAEVRMDNQGRLMLPSPLREDARLTGEVVVLGNAGRMQPGFLEVENHEQVRAELKPMTQTEMESLAAAGL